MNAPRSSSEAPTDDGGRQYHIGLARGEVAASLLLVGDPARVTRGAALLDDVGETKQHREYTCVTGTFRGAPVSILGTGIGSDNTEIAVVELARIIPPTETTIIRVGSSGAISDAASVGDLVVSTGALRLESTSLAFVDPGFPAIAHHDVVRALLDACEAHVEPPTKHFAGLTASACGFYGAQGRRVEGIPHKHPHRVEELAAQRVVNMEMECSCLFTLATLFGMRAGAVCAIFADRHAGTFLDPDARSKAELAALRVGLEALVNVAQ